MLKTLLWIYPLLCLFSSCRQQTKEDTLSILFTGDVLLDRGTRPWIEREGVKGLFQGVSEAFQKADAVVINLECPLTERHTPVGKKFVFRGKPTWAKALRQAGITHAALANNHTMGGMDWPILITHSGTLTLSHSVTERRLKSRPLP